MCIRDSVKRNIVINRHMDYLIFPYMSLLQPGEPCLLYTSQEGDTMNFTAFRGKDVNSGEVIDLAETMPFFADRRVILIEDSGLFKKGGEQLADYMKEPASSVCILFIESEVDKRSRLFKAVRDCGCAVEFATQDETTPVSYTHLSSRLSCMAAERPSANGWAR